MSLNKWQLRLAPLPLVINSGVIGVYGCSLAKKRKERVDVTDQNATLTRESASSGFEIHANTAIATIAVRRYSAAASNSGATRKRIGSERSLLACGKDIARSTSEATGEGTAD